MQAPLSVQESVLRGDRRANQASHAALRTATRCAALRASRRSWAGQIADTDVGTCQPSRPPSARRDALCRRNGAEGMCWHCCTSSVDGLRDALVAEGQSAAKAKKSMARLLQHRHEYFSPSALLSFTPHDRG